MVSRPTTTDVAVILLLGCAAVGQPAQAHGPERRVTRDIVRLQGYRGAAPAGAKIVRELVLNAHGTDHRFFATDWQRFAVDQRPPPTESQRLTLQADLPVLNRFAHARPDQTVTLLAEQRPGGPDLFVLTLDLCPP
jgi:hypothetical protein